MKDDFNQENNESLMSDYFKEGSSLPPRSTIHSIKDNSNTGGNKTIRLILSSLIFVLIIACIVLFIFNDNFGFSLFTNNQEIEEEQGTNNNTEEDEFINEDEEEEDIIDSNDSNANELKDQTDENSETSEEPTNNNQTNPSANTEKIHIIQPGENLFRISLQYYGPGYTEALARYNNITEVDKLVAGYKLKIPSKEMLK